jgi:hypothetical protein
MFSFFLVCVEFVRTYHTMPTQGPRNLNSRRVFALLDVCLVSITQQMPADKHGSYYRAENVRSKLRELEVVGSFYVADRMSSFTSHSESTLCVGLNGSCVSCGRVYAVAGCSVVFGR